MKPRAVHLATDHERMALCGWPCVDTEPDITKVTCGSCRRMFRARAVPNLVEALATTLAPSAGPPPRVTPQLWAGSCRGGEHRRCGECALCLWEREANRWAGVEAWNHVLRPRRSESTPRWGSATAALCELVEWERHGRVGPSAFGGMLWRLEMGQVEGGRDRADDRLCGRAGELVVVRQALELAYPLGAHALSQPRRIGLLLVRTAGVVTPLPTYAELSALLGETEGELRALVRHGRAVVALELSTRGLVPVSKHERLQAAVRAL